MDFPNPLPSCLTILLCGQVLFVLWWVRWWRARSSRCTTANGQFPSQSIWTTTTETRAEWTPFTQGDCCWVGHHRCVKSRRYYHWFILLNFIIISEKKKKVIIIHTWRSGFFVESKILVFNFLIPSNKSIFLSLLLAWVPIQRSCSNIHLFSHSPLKCFKDNLLKR